MTLYDVHRLVRWYRSTRAGKIPSIRRTHSRLGCGNSEFVPGTTRLPAGYGADISPVPWKPSWDLHSHRQSGGLRLQLLRQNRAYIGSTAHLRWVNTDARLLHTFTCFD